MVYPWMLQELLGGTNSDDSDDSGCTKNKRRKNRRAKNPTSATKTTFTMNWSHSENGATDPQPVPGKCTFMGVATTIRDEEDEENRASLLSTAIKLLRKAGYTCVLPLDGFKPDSDSEKEYKKDPEKVFLEENYDPVVVQKDNENVIMLQTFANWIYMQCANEAVADMVKSKFGGAFALGRVEHETKTHVLRDDLVVTVRTGNCNKDEERQRTGVGTLFELKKSGKLISKCLCSYHNCEMGNAGPTIELLETAAEWQQHGYGGELLAFVESHFQSIFVNVELASWVKFNICYVTNRHACAWFLNHGFEDWDGIGEELGKRLFDDEYDC